MIVLHREAQTPRSVGLGTVVTERVQDSIALLLLLFVAVPFAPPVTWLRGATLLLAFLAAGLVVTLVALRLYGSRPLGFLLRPLARLPGFSPARTELAAAGILRGLSGLRNARMALASFSLTVLYWLGFSLSFTLALRGVGLELGLDAGILVAVATTFSLLLPSLPASIGHLRGRSARRPRALWSRRGASALGRGGDPRPDVRSVPDRRAARPARPRGRSSAERKLRAAELRERPERLKAP